MIGVDLYATNSIVRIIRHPICTYTGTGRHENKIVQRPSIPFTAGFIIERNNILRIIPRFDIIGSVSVTYIPQISRGNNYLMFVSIEILVSNFQLANVVGMALIRQAAGF